jgi:hypothetical protein
MEKRKMKEGSNGIRPRKQPLGYVYVFTIVMLTLTGFGQMPIFKRYYIADIPGLGWLAQFYVTHYMHYMGAILLLGIAGYVMARYLAFEKKDLTLTVSGTIRVILLLLLTATGILLVLRNFSGMTLPPGLIILLDISHLFLVMLLLGVTGISIVSKQPWMVAKPAARETE